MAPDLSCTKSDTMRSTTEHYGIGGVATYGEDGILAMKLGVSGHGNRITIRIPGITRDPNLLFFSCFLTITSVRPCG